MFIISGIIVVALNWADIKHAASIADWNIVPLAFLFTVISYFLISFSFLDISRLFGVNIGAWDLIEIGYVTNVLDNLLPAVGLPGLSLRVLMLKRRGARTNESVAPSLFRSYFNNVIFIAILPFALIYALLNHPLPEAEASALIITTILVTLFAIMITAMVFSMWIRRKLLLFISRFWRFFTKRDIEKSLSDFEVIFSKGIDRIKQRSKQTLTVVGAILLSWLTIGVVIWFCFIALKSDLSYGMILAGFLIGRTSGVISFLPGGLGTQDASMVGFYTLFGIPLAQALLVAILFRAVYYFIPFAISIGFYQHLLRRPEKDD